MWKGKTLFECSRIQINPHVLRWIKLHSNPPTHVDYGESNNITISFDWQAHRAIQYLGHWIATNCDARLNSPITA